MAQDTGKKVAIVGGLALALLLLFGGDAGADEPTNEPKPPKPKPPGPRPTGPRGPGGLRPTGPLPEPPEPPTPQPPRTPGDIPFTVGDLPDEPDPPEVVPDPPLDDILKDYPTPGTFYQVKQGDRFGGTNPYESIAYHYCDGFRRKFGGGIWP